MRHIRTLCLTVLLCSLITPPALASASLADLKDLKSIQQRLTSIYIDSYHPAIKREIQLIRGKLRATPVNQRSRVLQTLAEQTKWGAPERATARYVCARYGVDYERSRDYLLNVLFWGSPFSHGSRPSARKAHPFIWGEGTADLLYELYERNHDFRLLHALVTGLGDGALGEVLDSYKVTALRDHPRGMLHVATMSEKGLRLAESVLTGEFGSMEEKDTLTRAERVFRAYARRVAADPKDPLAELAGSLIREADRRVRGKIRLKVDGKMLYTEPRAEVRGGRAFVPATAFYYIGLWVKFYSRSHCAVGWPESDAIIDFKAGKSTYTADGPKPGTARLPGTPYMSRGVLMVPLRSMLSNKDTGTSITAEWDNDTRTVHVHRSKSWLRWRLKENRELIKNSPGNYATPVGGSGQ